MSPEFANKNLQVMQQQENHFATLKRSLDNNRSRAATTTLSNTYQTVYMQLLLIGSDT
jgi:hypothetical protein